MNLLNLSDPIDAYILSDEKLYQEFTEIEYEAEVGSSAIDRFIDDDESDDIYGDEEQLSQENVDEQLSLPIIDIVDIDCLDDIEIEVSPIIDPEDYSLDYVLDVIGL